MQRCFWMEKTGPDNCLFVVFRPICLRIIFRTGNNCNQRLNGWFSNVFFVIFDVGHLHYQDRTNKNVFNWVSRVPKVFSWLVDRFPIIKLTKTMMFHVFPCIFMYFQCIFPCTFHVFSMHFPWLVILNFLTQFGLGHPASVVRSLSLTTQS